MQQKHVESANQKHWYIMYLIKKVARQTKRLSDELSSEWTSFSWSVPPSLAERSPVLVFEFSYFHPDAAVCSSDDEEVAVNW